MKLSYNKNARDPIYYIQQGFRKGNKTSTRNVHRIGKHSELLLVTDDPLEYAKQMVAERNEEMKKNKISMELKIDFEAKLKAGDNTASSSSCLNIGYFFLQSIYHKLRISDFFKAYTAGSKIEYNPDEANRFMVYARILEPDSKHGTYDCLSSYYEQPGVRYEQMLRTMDIMEEHYDEYLAHLWEQSNRVVKRDTSVCYFDCTNYYFETEGEDEDYIDEVTGEMIKGLRKYGRAKDHRPNPLVSMGLFMDTQGIPISMCINSGSDNEQTCAIPLEKKLIEMFKDKKFIYCADAGLGSYNIRKFNSMGGKSFVVTQSVKKLPDVVKEAVFNDFDYRLLSSNKKTTIARMKAFDKMNTDNLGLYNDFVYKIIPATIALENGRYEEKTYANGRKRAVKSKDAVPQKIIVTFSRKSMEYQRRIRNNQIERAKKLLQTKDPEEIKKGSNDVRRFIKRTSTGKDGKKANDSYEINQTIIDEEEKYDGYYAIATNLDDDVNEILRINKQRYKIEDCFRVMKTNFEARPVHHSKSRRIKAHFMICYTALLVYRLLEAKLDENGTHFSVDNVINTLKNMQVASVQDIFHVSTYDDSKVCAALNEIFMLGLDKKYYQPKELNKKIKKIL